MIASITTTLYVNCEMLFNSQTSLFCPPCCYWSVYQKWMKISHCKSRLQNGHSLSLKVWQVKTFSAGRLQLFMCFPTRIGILPLLVMLSNSGCLYSNFGKYLVWTVWSFVHSVRKCSSDSTSSFLQLAEPLLFFFFQPVLMARLCSLESVLVLCFMSVTVVR